MSADVSGWPLRTLSLGCEPLGSMNGGGLGQGGLSQTRTQPPASHRFQSHLSPLDGGQPAGAQHCRAISGQPCPWQPVLLAPVTTQTSPGLPAVALPLSSAPGPLLLPGCGSRPGPTAQAKACDQGRRVPALPTLWNREAKTSWWLFMSTPPQSCSSSSWSSALASSKASSWISRSASSRFL